MLKFERFGAQLPNHPPQNLTIATTGASGSIFLRQLLRRWNATSAFRPSTSSPLTALCASWLRSSDCTAAATLSDKFSDRRTKSNQVLRKIKQQANADIGANIASGSYPADAMIVIPCSMGTLARIANGIASQLIERAADVCLKEKRPLVLCVRETPLNKIHIRNLYRAADAGATVFPLIPAYYFRPASLDAMASEFAYRVLAHIGLPQPNAYRWKG